MKKNIHILIILLGLIAFSSCEKEALTVTLNKPELNEEVEEGYANLEISMNTPALQVTSRSLESDPKNEGNTWTVWEKFVDGALLYHVTLFVIEDTSGKLVAYRHFYTGSPDIQADDSTTKKGGNGFYEGYTENALWSGTVNTTAKTGVAVKATFKASSPLHGEMEKLKPGNYTIIAVANYSPIVSTSETGGLLNTTLGLDATQTYAGLGNISEDGDAETDITNNNGTGGDFTSLVNALTTNKTTNNNFAGVENAFGESLFAYQLNSGADRVCKQFPQPLVMIRKKTLVAGNNQLEGELSRTFARVRVEVKNNDTVQYLGVYGFNFKDNYASRRAYLFNDIHTAAASINTAYTNFALYKDTKGTIDVTSEDAVETFTAVNEGDMRRMPPNTTFPMFDCYILEGQLAGQFAFQFYGCYWSEGSGGAATPELMITNFYKSEYDADKVTDEYREENANATGQNRPPYGLLEFNVFIRCETADPTTLTGNASSSVTLLKSPIASTSSTGNLIAEIPKDDEGNNYTTITLGGENATYIAPEYIWQIKLNTTEKEYNNGTDLTYGSGVTSEQSSGRPQGGSGGNMGSSVGYESGSLQNLGSGLYLQAYDGGTDMTPKLSEDPDNTLIFKINLGPTYEVGTIFCYLDSDDAKEGYYYLKYDATNGIKWVKFTGTTFDENNGEYRYFTWETIGGTAGKRTDVLVEKTIDNTAAETATNKIVRNDFFYGIVPISYSSASANSTTTTSGSSSE